MTKDGKSRNYEPRGVSAMCWFSFVCFLVSSFCLYIINKKQKTKKSPLAPDWPLCILLIEPILATLLVPA